MNPVSIVDGAASLDGGAIVIKVKSWYAVSYFAIVLLDFDVLGNVSLAILYLLLSIPLLITTGHCRCVADRRKSPTNSPQFYPAIYPANLPHRYPIITEIRRR